ncbi:MAG: hypothetical protein AAF517_08960 [Planctomycetota bacterium]
MRTFVGLFTLSLLASCGAAPVSETLSDHEWLENMVRYHGYDASEVGLALGVSAEEAAVRVEAANVPVGFAPKDGAGRIRVVPYPGGRHPRIGFLEGAIDPHRDTKFSAFLPWEREGYVVVDLPEAIWGVEPGREPELQYLAHTHIPTVWDRKQVKLDHVEWKRQGAQLVGERVFPNGLEFRTRVTPTADFVDMEMTLRNGTEIPLSGLRTQICVMLKGAPSFNDQTNDNKELLEADRIAAARSKDGKRWILTIWERSKPWGNKDCPCIHADPVFPDLKPGAGSTVRGRLFFVEGEDLESAIDGYRRAGLLEFGPS